MSMQKMYLETGEAPGPARVLWLSIAGFVSLALAVGGLFMRNWAVVAGAGALCQVAMVAIGRAKAAQADPDRGGLRPSPRRRPRPSRTRTEAEAWLLTETLSELTTAGVPVPESQGEERYAVVSLRTGAPLQYFPTWEDGQSAVRRVARQMPDLGARLSLIAA